MKNLSIISLLAIISCGHAPAVASSAQFYCSDGSRPTTGSGYDTFCDEAVFYTYLGDNIRCDTDADCFDGGNAKYDYDEQDVYCYKGTYGYVSNRETYGICAYKYRNEAECKSNQFFGSWYATTLDNPILDNVCMMCPDNATCDGKDVECHDGYYLTNTNTPYNPICAKCPGAPGLIVHSNNAIRIEECYATGGTDSSGTFEYAGMCTYSE